MAFKRFAVKCYSLLCLPLLFSCKSAPSASQTQDFAASASERNVAVVIGAPMTGTSNQLTGIDKDLANVKDAILGLNQGFVVASSYDESKIQALTAVAKAANSLGPNGTLLVYFSGHGDESGRLVTKSDAGASAPFDFISSTELALVLGIARTVNVDNPTPIRRFIFIIDSCFSGQWVDGSGSQFINAFNIGFQNAFNSGIGSLPALYRQFFGFSAARANQTSSVISAAVGSAFTYSFIQALLALRSNSSSTIQDLIDHTKTNMTHLGLKYQPEPFAYPSTAILTETLF